MWFTHPQEEVTLKATERQNAVQVGAANSI